jgi:hypothetical protein
MKGVRRREKEITERSEMARILREAKYVTVAMCEDDTPYLVTLSHGYDETKNELYFHCAQEGKKVDILNQNSLVWGQAMIDYGYVQGKCDHLYESVHFKGHVEFIDDVEEKRRALEVMIRQLDKTPEKVATEQLTPDSTRRVKIGKIEIDYLTGKKSKQVIISM